MITEDERVFLDRMKKKTENELFISSLEGEILLKLIQRLEESIDFMREFPSRDYIDL